MNRAAIRRSHQDAADSFIARAVAIFVIAMAAQSVGEVLAQSPQVAVWWLVVLGGSMACSGSWVAMSGLLGRSQRLALTIFALAAVVGLGLWPVAHPAAEVGAPWVWNVLGLCVACVAAAWPSGASIGCFPTRRSAPFGRTGATIRPTGLPARSREARPQT